MKKENYTLTDEDLIYFSRFMLYCENDLKKTYPNYNWKQGKRILGNETDEEIINWINE